MKITNRLPVIALVGRPNVGKSTLFNRLTGGTKSIVHETPGATRDRVYKEASILGKRFLLVDTGGLMADASDPLGDGIASQTKVAINQADAIILLVDAQTGLLPQDTEIAAMLRRSSKKAFVAANKADSQALKHAAGEFHSLSLDGLMPVSALQGQGINEVFSLAFESLEIDWESVGEIAENSSENSCEGDPEQIRLAVIGRPNVGKSSFVNKVLGEERHLTSEIPGTTMDAVDTEFDYFDRKFLLIDTAGIRRKRSVAETMEKMAISKSLKALDRCDIAVLFIDAIQGLTEQDMKVADFACKKGKALIIVVNKWDLAKKEGFDANTYAKQIRQRAPFLTYAPIRFVSAKTGLRVFEVLDCVIDISKEYFKRVKTAAVNKLLEKATEEHQPPVHSGKRIRLYFGTQIAVAPPSFVFISNQPKAIHFSYQRYLVNRIREEFGFKGVPLRLKFRSREKEQKKHAS